MKMNKAPNPEISREVENLLWEILGVLQFWASRGIEPTQETLETLQGLRDKIDREATNLAYPPSQEDGLKVQIIDDWPTTPED